MAAITQRCQTWEPTTSCPGCLPELGPHISCALPSTALSHSAMHQDAFSGPTVKRFPSYLFCGSFPSEMVIWLEKSPGISSCSQLWLSTSQDKGTLAGERNSRTPTFPHITCDFVLELMQELPQRSSCRQAYLYPRL